MPLLSNMSIDDFEKIRAARSESFEEASPEKKAKILNGLLMENPQDVYKWLQFVRLQDDIVADYNFDKNDSDAKKKVANEKKLDILKTALQKNSRSIDLKLERMKIMEMLYGANDPRVDTEWKKVSVGGINNCHENSLVREFPFK